MPIAKSFVGASLLAHMMASKFVDHLPIYRLLQMFTRQKIVIEDNTINNWFRQGCTLLQPLYEVHKQQVLQSIPSTNPVIFFQSRLHSFAVEVHEQHLFYGR